MRSCLLTDERCEAAVETVLTGVSIGSRISAYGKFSDRQFLVMEEDILLNELSAFSKVLEISATVINGASIFELKPQILEIQSFKIYACYMK